MSTRGVLGLGLIGLGAVFAYFHDNFTGMLFASVCLIVCLLVIVASEAQGLVSKLRGASTITFLRFGCLWMVSSLSRWYIWAVHETGALPLLCRGEGLQGDDALRHTLDLPEMRACLCPGSPNVQCSCKKRGELRGEPQWIK